MNIENNEIVARPGWIVEHEGILVDGYRFAYFINDYDGGYFHYVGSAFIWEDYERRKSEVVSVLN